VDNSTQVFKLKVSLEKKLLNSEKHFWCPIKILVNFFDSSKNVLARSERDFDVSFRDTLFRAQSFASRQPIHSTERTFNHQLRPLSSIVTAPSEVTRPSKRSLPTRHRPIGINTTRSEPSTRESTVAPSRLYRNPNYSSQCLVSIIKLSSNGSNTHLLILT